MKSWYESFNASSAPGLESVTGPGMPRAGLGILRSAFQRGTRAWDWLQQKRVQQIASRRLRVAETVSLGEKRFVSLIEVDGSQFLIGGAAGSVTLLAVMGGEQGRPHGDANHVCGAGQV